MNTVEVPVAPHEGHTLLSWQRVQPAVYAGSYLRVLDCALGRVARLKADGQLVERELGLAAVTAPSSRAKNSSIILSSSIDCPPHERPFDYKDTVSTPYVSGKDVIR